MLQLQGAKQRRIKVQNPQNKRHRCNHFLLNKIDGEVVTNKLLKHNLTCSLTNDKPLNEQVKTACPSTRTKNVSLTRTDSIPPLMQSPSPPHMLEINNSSSIPPMITSPPTMPTTPTIPTPPTNPSPSTMPPSF